MNKNIKRLKVLENVWKNFQLTFTQLFLIKIEFYSKMFPSSYLKLQCLIESLAFLPRPFKQILSIQPNKYQFSIKMKRAEKTAVPYKITTPNFERI